jgi:aminoglycoside/choline kinase family phosphotransferase
MGFDDRSCIVMLLPPPEGPADEGGARAEVLPLEQEPFVLTQRWLHRLGLPVPELRFLDPVERTLWLSDAGDVDLDQAVTLAPGRRLKAYGDAVDLNLRWLRTVSLEDAPTLVRDRAMDPALLRWELEHWVEWRLGADLGVVPDAASRAALDAVFTELVEALSAMPQVVIHRDFQSHNLMVPAEGDLVLLDFQDAMVGPLVYDLVALLRDSYVTLAPPELDALLDRWVEGLQRTPPAGLKDPPAPETLRRWFHLQTLQRKLKDVGRFVYIDRVKHHPGFLRYIPASLHYLRESLDALEEGGRWRPVLAALDPSLGAPGPA